MDATYLFLRLGFTLCGILILILVVLGLGLIVLVVALTVACISLDRHGGRRSLSRGFSHAGNIDFIIIWAPEF